MSCVKKYRKMLAMATLYGADNAAVVFTACCAVLKERHLNLMPPLYQHDP